MKLSNKFKVGLIDYGVGNLGSVISAFNVMDIDVRLIEKASDLKLADCLILPGVGNYASCKALLDAGGWTQSLVEETYFRQKPLLGICLGMQLLSTEGYEGAKKGEKISGLSFVEGSIISLKDSGCSDRIPHVGWNSISIQQTKSPIFNGIPNITDFYFVHSYRFIPDNIESIVASVDYGGLSIPAAIQNQHIWGVQFHPEKSSKAGLKLLSNFYNYSINAKS